MKLSDPFEILAPEKHWIPAQSQLDAFQNDYDKLLPPLVHKIRLAVQKWRAAGYEGASDTSKSLLKFWFSQEHFVNGNRCIKQEDRG
jgi:type III restriction enzyme